MPEEDRLAEIQGLGRQLLVDNAYQQYEVSAFSKNNQHSKHNINYWEFGDYIGIGAGAHGKYTDVTNNAIIRRRKTRLPNNYLYTHSHKNSYKNSAPSYKEHTVESHELPLEFLMNSLRLVNGVPIDYFTQRTGLHLNVLDKTLKTSINQGLVEIANKRIKTTPFGQAFLNTILAQL